ncbi:class I SAM-dependent methyltransferase [candidate division KSB1 bacterium]
MEKNKKTDVKDFFNEYAYDFDALYGTRKNILNVLINPVFRKSMKTRFKRTIQYSSPYTGMTFLDVGCGPGHYPVELAKLGAKSITGIDFSEEMINIARNNARHAHVAEICKFIVGDVLEYCPNKKFDIAIVMGVMDYIEYPEIFVKKLIDITSSKILFSFPSKKGVLSFQRKVRYKNRCPLYMYDKTELARLFDKFSHFTYDIEKISRDFFVSLQLESEK